MYTRCVHCDSVFRVTLQQLQSSSGQVRCGVCEEIFDAFQHLSATDPAELIVEGQPDPSTATGIAPAVTGDALPESAEAAGGWAGEPGSEPPPPEATEAPPGIADHVDVEVPALPAEEPAATPGAGESSVPPAPETLPGPESPAAPASNGDRAESPPTQDFDDAIFAYPEDPAAAPPPPAEEVAAAIEQALPVGSGSRTEELVPESVRLGERVDFVAGRRPRRIGNRLLVAGAALLALVLPAQGLVYFRGALVDRLPAVRPAVAGFCSLLGCDTPLPRLTDQLVIESSDLQAPDPGRPNRVILVAEIGNNAPFRQACPSIELTFTDAADQVVARRVLEPAEYLEAPSIAADGIPARGQIDLRLQIDTGSVTPAGYRIYLFHH